MNTIQTQAVVPAKAASSTTDVHFDKAKTASLDSQTVNNRADYYSASAANDSVVAKVLSQSLTKSIGNLPTSNYEISNRSPVQEKLNIEQMTSQPTIDIKQVSDNVVGFVQSALGKLASNGHNTEALSFFRNEAVKGVEVGIDQAKLELVGLASEQVFSSIDSTKQSIVDGINKLSTSPQEYIAAMDGAENIAQGTEVAFNTISVNTKNASAVNINFENRAFDASAKESQVFTSSSSNISFAITGQGNSENTAQIADFINKTDGLVNSFYRGGIESAYEKSINNGYSNTELVNFASQIRLGENVDKMRAYEGIQQLSHSDSIDGSAPKAVAAYINKFLDVMESSQKTLEADEDFNQVINGIVNQMKDVQVPDLLKAINRFHAFNKNFV